jgi:hypothetical protein
VWCKLPVGTEEHTDFSGPKSKPCKKPIGIKHDAVFLDGYLLDLFSTMKMEAARSSEMSVNFYQTTRHHVTEDCIPLCHRCDNFKFRIIITFRD